MSNLISKDVGQNLKKWREESGLTQRYMAELLNVTICTYANYEAGRTIIGPAAIQKICEHFNISADLILFNCGHKLRMENQEQIDLRIEGTSNGNHVCWKVPISVDEEFRITLKNY